MNNKDNKKNISNSYKDYKYEYTGYKEFVKKHHLDKEEIKQEKEKIVHDHRLKFDFNNPNQHQHDYSFDFNNPNEHQHDYSFDFSQEKPKQTSYKDKYGNTQTKKTTYTTPTYKSNTTNNNSSRYGNSTTTIKISTPEEIEKSKKVVKYIIFIFFFLPIIMEILGGLLSLIFNNQNNDYDYNEKTEYEYEYDSNYDNDYNYDYDYDNEEVTSHLEPINGLCKAIEYKNIAYIEDYIRSEEYKYDYGLTWSELIYNYSSLENYNIKCGEKTKKYLSINNIKAYQNEFNNKFSTNITISDAYQINIKKLSSENQYLGEYQIIVGKIYGKWYLIKPINEIGDPSAE